MTRLQQQACEASTLIESQFQDLVNRGARAEDIAMKVIYDRETDSLVITLRDAPIQESDEVRPGVIADFGEDGGVVRFEVLRASRAVEDAEQVQFATTG
jgi:uncharacterized protein YuzE